MKMGAAMMALAMFVGTSSAFAEDKPEVAEPAVDAGSGPAASNGEITLDNAAVNRALAGGETTQPVVPPRPHRFGFYFGIRAMNLKNAGYDPYSNSDALVQNAIGFSYSPLRAGAFSLHLLAEWNLGASNAYARSASADLLINRLALGLEARVMPTSRFYLFAKAVPGAVYMGGSINDYELGVKLESSSWTWMVDVAGGAAIRLGTAGKEPKRTASFWFMMDWGYTFAGQATMAFRPANIDDATRTFGAVNLPGFRPNGFVTRSCFAVTF